MLHYDDNRVSTSAVTRLQLEATGSPRSKKIQRHADVNDPSKVDDANLQPLWLNGVRVGVN